MDKLAILRGDDGYHDEQMLETDVMRFLAIIGIIFWVIFALVKSVPFQAPEVDFLNDISMETVEPLVDTARETAIPDEKKQRLPPIAQRVEEEPLKKPADIREQKSMPPPQIGIRIQFSSMDDLMGLLRDRKVEVFGRAQARGFDLFFAGHPVGDTIEFKGETNLPQKLWEIKSGRDYEYFLTLLSKTYPAIRTFPTKQVLISFTDSEIESRFEEAITRLELEKKNGVLSVTRSGDVVFQESGRVKYDKGDER
jgi:hypothetical protein